MYGSYPGLKSLLIFSALTGNLIKTTCKIKQETFRTAWTDSQQDSYQDILTRILQHFSQISKILSPGQLQLFKNASFSLFIFPWAMPEIDIPCRKTYPHRVGKTICLSRTLSFGKILVEEAKHSQKKLRNSDSPQLSSQFSKKTENHK